MSSLGLALPSALLDSSSATPAVTASLTTSITTEWVVTHSVVNGTTVPATAITAVIRCDVCTQQEQATHTCLLDTAAQQAAGGGGGGGGLGSATVCSGGAAVLAAMETNAASPSPQERWWGGTLLTQEGTLGPTAGLSATSYATADAAVLWGNLAVLSGFLTAAVGLVLWK